MQEMTIKELKKIVNNNLLLNKIKYVSIYREILKNNSPKRIHRKSLKWYGLYCTKTNSVKAEKAINKQLQNTKYYGTIKRSGPRQIESLFMYKRI